MDGRGLAVPYCRDTAAFAVLTAMLVVVAATASIGLWPGDISGVRAFSSVANDATRLLCLILDSLGQEVVVIPATVAAAVALFLVKATRLGWLFALAMLVNGLAILLLKEVVDRPRPVLLGELTALAIGDGTSFPSGHVALTTGFFGAGLWALGRSGRSRGMWYGAAVLACVPVVLMGPTRVAWGAHWPSDVLGGYVLGIWSACLPAVLDRLLSRWSRRGAG